MKLILLASTFLFLGYCIKCTPTALCRKLWRKDRENWRKIKQLYKKQQNEKIPIDAGASQGKNKIKQSKNNRKSRKNQ